MPTRPARPESAADAQATMSRRAPSSPPRASGGLLSSRTGWAAIPLRLIVGCDKRAQAKDIEKARATGKTAKPAGLPFRAADYPESQVEIAEYLDAMLADGDERAVPVALRIVADAGGGMTALAEKTGRDADEQPTAGRKLLFGHEQRKGSAHRGFVFHGSYWTRSQLRQPLRPASRQPSIQGNRPRAGERDSRVP